MAPTSHLLVYYTTEKGETINDVISFNVKQTDPKVLNFYTQQLFIVILF
jgi:hypothetical protein